jgi:polyferredoxin
MSEAKQIVYIMREVCGECIVRAACTEVCDKLDEEFERWSVKFPRVMDRILHDLWRNNQM